jgi:hypothetical protein
MTRSEAILEARKRKQAGDFNRQIAHITPCDLYTDLIELTCGHARTAPESSRRLDESMRDLRRQATTDDPAPGGEPCDRCAEEWIIRHTEAAGESG